MSALQLCNLILLIEVGLQHPGCLKEKKENRLICYVLVQVAKCTGGSYIIQYSQAPIEVGPNYGGTLNVKNQQNTV